MNQAPLRVALAGAGMISWYHLLAWKKLEPRVRLVAVCDPDTTRARKRAEEFGIPHAFASAEDLFANQDIDVLDVASPRETHAPWVESAAARGIATLCQKPLTPTLAEANALVEAVSGKARLMVHENWRFRPWYRRARQWIEYGALGELLLGRMMLLGSGMLPDASGERPAFVRQPFMTREHRLMISEVLIHHLDTMRYLCGPLRVVAARTRRSLQEAKGETFAAIFLETAEDCPVEVTGTMAAPGFPPRASDRLELIGSKASLVFDDFKLRLLGETPRSERFDAGEGYQASFDAVIAHFIDCVGSGQPFETSPTDNMETMRLVEHAYLAAGQSTAA